jgi:hypothetical protein
MDDNSFGIWLRARAVTIALVVATLVLAGMTATRASADTQTFGSNLSSAPTLDTANGDYSNTGALNPTERAIGPYPHSASDTSIWNVTGPGTLASPAGGQVLDIQLEGCAREDTTAPEQTSQGVAVNSLVFQTLSGSGGSYTVGVDSADDSNGNPFTLPFCSSSRDVTSGAVNTSTVTTFQPIHMCISAGSFVDFHDIGGFVPRAADGTGPWYPEGVPFEVLATQQGSSMDSLVGGDAPPGAVYASSDPGWATENNEELQMQVVLGTGGDAYGLCPGGTANESSTSNEVICDYGTASNGHPLCDRNGNPVSGTSTGTSTGTGTGTGTGTKKGKGGVKTAAPKLSMLLLNHTAMKPKAGLTVSYSDTVTGTTSVRVTKELFGRKSGKKCVTKVEKRLSHNPVCRFFVSVEVVHHVDAIGRNSVQLVTKNLKPGTYQVNLVSTFGTHTSRTFVKTFKVK